VIGFLFFLGTMLLWGLLMRAAGEAGERITHSVLREACGLVEGNEFVLLL